MDSVIDEKNRRVDSLLKPVKPQIDSVRANARTQFYRIFTTEQRAGKLLPVVSSGNIPGTLAIDQDAAIYVSSLKSGESVKHSVAGTHAYLFVTKGEVTVNDLTANQT